MKQLLNEVKENRIYLAGLGVLLEKVAAFVSDEKKVLLLAKMVTLSEAVQHINNTPYGLFTSREVDGRISLLNMHLMELKCILTDLLPTHGLHKEHQSTIQNALKAIEGIYDY